MSKRQNAARPEGFAGRRMVHRMNSGAHAALSEWGLGQLSIPDAADVLEIGCGGGANVARLLAAAPNGRVTGVDYSEVSVRASRRLNAAAIRAGRCEIRQENVQELSLADSGFDLVTAFETIYFWPDIGAAFAQVYRVLREGGTFFICNETDGEDAAGYQWEAEIEGMKIYTIDEIEGLLRQAGFAEVRVARASEHPWVCFAAGK